MTTEPNEWGIAQYRKHAIERMQRDIAATAAVQGQRDRIAAMCDPRPYKVYPVDTRILHGLVNKPA